MASANLPIAHNGNRQTTLTDLHPDLLLKILVYTTPRDVNSLSCSCKHLYAICNMNLLWKYILIYRYGYKIHPTHIFHTRDSLYKYFVLRYYCHVYPIVGLWLLHLSPYNMVMQISQSDTMLYALEGIMYFLGAGSEFLSDQVSSHSIATFRVSQPGELGDSGDTVPNHHEFTVLTDEHYYDHFKPCNEFDLVHSECKPGSVMCCINIRCDEVIGLDPYALAKFDQIQNRRWSRRSIYVSKLSLNKCNLPSNYTLLPGIYKGTFSADTYQLTLLYYQGGWIHCKKLTGDVKIPGGKIILKAEHKNIKPSSQPFPLDLARGGTYTYDIDHPIDRFVACYKGESQLALRGFLYPTSCAGKMYVADEESFVFVTEENWFNVSYFRRCPKLSQLLYS